MPVSPDSPASPADPTVEPSTGPAPSSKGRFFAALATLLVVGALAIAFGANRAPEATTATSSIEGFTLPALRGSETVSLSDRGSRPAVVNFFASWCAPCRKELPLFEKAAAANEGRLAFFGVAHQDDATLAAEMLSDFGITYPAGNDPEGRLARQYALRGMPSTLFVTADGRLLGVAAGELDAAGLQDWIERLLDA
jgi:thiol-disulfide isomerase/thioredoxin